MKNKLLDHIPLTRDLSNKKWSETDWAEVNARLYSKKADYYGVKMEVMEMRGEINTIEYKRLVKKYKKSLRRLVKAREIEEGIKAKNEKIHKEGRFNNIDTIIYGPVT